jgi:arylsulfatase A-like enzyme
VRNADKALVEESGYITDVFGDEAVQFIERHKDESFFLYSAFNAPHSPFQVTQEYYDRFPEVENELQRIYFGMIAALDDAVGRILDALEENGLAENTLVVFLSDNGCAGYFPGLCSCEPLSGGKLTFYEGGVRVPFLMRWPQEIEAGSRVNMPVSSLDILPTAIAAAGQTAPEGLVLDGQDLLPLFEEGGGGPHHDRLVFRMAPAIAIRQGDMKLIKPNQDEPLGFLYDLSVDEREQNNLAGEHPEVIQSLEEEIEDWRSITVEPAWGPRPPVTYSICNIEPIGFEV